MRYQQLPASLYIKNRQKLAARLKPGSVAVFNANDIMPGNADGSMPFRQHSDLFYLTGIDQEETILVIAPNASKAEWKEMVFVRKTSDEILVWEGYKLTKDQATAVSGIQNVYWLDDFEVLFKKVVCEAEHIYLNTNEHLRASNPVETRDDRFRKALLEKYPLHKYDRLQPIMHRLRSVKEKEEIGQIAKACDITRLAFDRVCGFVRPGVKEYEIEAELLHEFVRHGSRRPAYEPIIASGANSCVLHYTSNDQACQDGDLLLLDFGCEYGNYAADLTRTIPVNGRFTPRQREVYDAVLRVQREAMTLLRPGKQLDDYHKEVGLLMEKELLQLGLITADDIKNQDPAWPAYKKYFMHGTSHYLGLDVHDYGMWHEPIQEGNVFTVEPGIYIREEGIGIRLENNIVVTQRGYDDLMADSAIEAEAVEEMMSTREPANYE
jgi:Xaa-Pro aminopeptidase